MNRRNALNRLLAGGFALGFPLQSLFPSPLKGRKKSGFFQVKKIAGRWWFIDPEGQRFFSRGLNHVDPASLRYEENGRIWRERYGNSMEKWLKTSVGPNLRAWGFNTLGWNQEVVTRGLTNHRHSRRFTYEEYQWLDMPYCHQLPFGEFHQWEAETRHPDFFSDDFVNWCDHVAREHCATLADDPKLIGYFYIDCPTWLHTRKENHWKGPLFDPSKLNTKAGRDELKRLATRYYQVTHDAIRRYDPNHLILGDRYEANEPLDPIILEAAGPYVDIFSFQDFREPVKHLQYWHNITGRPVLWADGSKKLTVDGKITAWNDARWYADILMQLQDNPGCVGVHLCGAYIQNKVRKKGLLDRQERFHQEQIDIFREIHRVNESWKRTT